MKPEPVLNRENLGFLLAKASQRWNELLAAEFRQAGYPEVSPAFGSILLPLFEEDGPRMAELGHRAGLSKQTMTTMVRLMEARELVRREPDRDDRRATRVFLTARGIAFREAAARALERMDAAVAERISSRQVAATRAALKTLARLAR